MESPAWPSSFTAASRADQLQDALTSPVVLEQAKGMLAARARIEVGQAFTLMRDQARRTGRTLRDVAAAVITARGRTLS